MASTGADYRYGYNGMEEEDRGDQVSAEIASTGEKAKPGEGNLLNTEYRLYDPRLAQWLTRDPVFQPWESPYSAMAGNPILFSDPQGDTPVGGNNGPIDQRVAPEGGGGTQTNPQALTGKVDLTTNNNSSQGSKKTTSTTENSSNSTLQKEVLVSSVDPIKTPTENTSPQKTFKLSNGEVLYLNIELSSPDEAYSYGREVGDHYVRLSMITGLQQTIYSLGFTIASITANANRIPIVLPNVQVKIGLFGSESGKNYIMDYIESDLTTSNDTDALIDNSAVLAVSATVFIPAKVPAGSLMAKTSKTLPIPKVTDPKLSNYVKDLYKGAYTDNPIGSGSTADAVRNEILTGLPTNGVFHSEKAKQYLSGLNKWLVNNPSASYNDKLVAKSLIDDLTSALNGK